MLVKVFISVYIEEKYAKIIQKILGCHDIDTYIILAETDKHELLNVFENIDDFNFSTE